MPIRLASMALLLFLHLSGATVALSQDRPFSIGGYLGTNASTISHPIEHRIGVQLSLSIVGPIHFYPGLDSVVDPGYWQAFLNARAIPFSGNRILSLWYFGAGAAVRKGDVAKAILTGLEWPRTQVQPFLEARFLGDIEHGDPEFQMLAGLRARLR